MLSKEDILSRVNVIIHKYSEFGTVTTLCLSTVWLGILDDRDKLEIFGNPLVVNGVTITALYLLEETEYQVQIISRF